MTSPTFTTQAFLDWLRAQPGEREFDYFSNQFCAAASFCKEVMHLEKVQATVTLVWTENGHVYIPEDVAKVLRSFAPPPGTFTAAQLLERMTS